MRLAALALLPALGATPVLAASGSVELAGRTILLPPGEWQELGRTLEERRLSDGTPYAEGAALFIATAPLSDGNQPPDASGTRPLGMVLIRHASRLPEGRAAWPVIDACAAEGGYRTAVLVTPRPDSQACLHVAHRLGPDTLALARMPIESAPTLWRSYVARLKEDADWGPRNWIAAAYRFADPQGALSVEYRFNPEAAGFPPDGRDAPANAWLPNRLDRTRTRFVTRIADWAQSNFPRLRNAFERGTIDRPLRAP
ncbi:hypothetical protein IAI18_04540 [Acetobacteraceae bacterium H6797]|nr:hypothetical protein [Acetobacteraceae bacterium H6797]